LANLLILMSSHRPARERQPYSCRSDFPLVFGVFPKSTEAVCAILFALCPSLQIEKTRVDAQRRRAEADVGPVRYLADLIATPATDLERLVRLLTLALVAALDSMAVALLLAAGTHTHTRAACGLTPTTCRDGLGLVGPDQKERSIARSYLDDALYCYLAYLCLRNAEGDLAVLPDSSLRKLRHPPFLHNALIA
jgi:hypothetical protein